MKPGDIMPKDQIYSDPPESADKSLIQFYGSRKNEECYRLYSVPSDRCVGEIVREFEVGSHGAESYGYNIAETVELVARMAIEIAIIVPCRVIFADVAGLKLRFLRQITIDEIRQIQGLFAEDTMMQAGLDRYVSEWDGEGLLFNPVFEENMFQFWWD